MNHQQALCAYRRMAKSRGWSSAVPKVGSRGFLENNEWPIAVDPVTRSAACAFCGHELWRGDIPVDWKKRARDHELKEHP